MACAHADGQHVAEELRYDEYGVPVNVTHGSRRRHLENCATCATAVSYRDRDQDPYLAD